MREALIHTCQERKNMIAAQMPCMMRIHAPRSRGGSRRSMKSMVTCSSACDTSGSPAKISTSSVSSVISKPPRIGRLMR
jgi:hypothetical protein